MVQCAAYCQSIPGCLSYGFYDIFNDCYAFDGTVAQDLTDQYLGYNNLVSDISCPVGN